MFKALVNRRSSLEIVAVMLKAIANGTHKPTNLMYAANIQWTGLRWYLEFLESQGFVVRKEIPLRNRTEYYLTKRGENFVNVWRRLEILLTKPALFEEPQITT